MTWTILLLPRRMWRRRKKSKEQAVIVAVAGAFDFEMLQLLRKAERLQTRAINQPGLS